MSTAVTKETLNVFIELKERQIHVPHFASEQPSQLDFASAQGFFWKELLLFVVYHAALGGTHTFHRDNY